MSDLGDRHGEVCASKRPLAGYSRFSLDGADLTIVGPLRSVFIESFEAGGKIERFY